MNWKSTAVFAVLLAVAVGIYCFSGPGKPRLGTQASKIVDFRGDDVTRIDIARAGEVAMTLERMSDLSGSYWRVTKPVERPADMESIQPMLWNVSRFSGAAPLDPGRPESDPKITGLQEPRLVLTLHAGNRKETLRFGKAPQTNTAGVFFQREGDPRVYLTDSALFDAYNKGVPQVRSKKLVRYEAYRAIRVDLENRQEKLRVREGESEKVVDVEKSVFQRFEQGEERGWFMVEPWKERLDDMKVSRLIMDLAELPVEEFQPPADLKQMGLAPPQIVVSITLNGVPKPVTVQMGSAVEKGDQKRFVHVVDSGEVARVETKRIDQLPTRRGHFRSDEIYAFKKGGIVKLSVVVPALGKVVLERREKVVKKEGKDEMTVSWEVPEPADVKIEKERVERFVDNILLQRIIDFLGSQPDLKPYNLDPPDATLTVEDKAGRKHEFYFGMKSDSPDAYLQRAGRDEIFKVRVEFVKLLKRLDLNFRSSEMFSVPRDRLREFRFEARERDRLEPLYYSLRLDEKDKKWLFADPAHKDVEADEGRVSDLLAMVNYIVSESLISRDPAQADYYKLNEKQASARLTVIADGETAPAVLYITEDLSDQPGQPLYYARLEGSPIVFQVKSLWVESLKRTPIKKPKPEDAEAPK